MLTIISEVGIIVDIETVQRHPKSDRPTASEQNEAALMSAVGDAPDLGLGLVASELDEECRHEVWINRLPVRGKDTYYGSDSAVQLYQRQQCSQPFVVQVRVVYRFHLGTTDQSGKAHVVRRRLS